MNFSRNPSVYQELGTQHDELRRRKVMQARAVHDVNFGRVTFTESTCGHAGRIATTKPFLHLRRLTSSFA